MQCPRPWAFPLVPFYLLPVLLRNLLFDLKILPGHSFPIPLIGVGNLAAGGSGKTPMTEYLVRLLGEKGTGILSRGYGRKSKGFRIVTDADAVSLCGDEPLQYARKFRDALVAVDANRRHGIAEMMRIRPLRRIVLDDVFQHRYVKPSLLFLLTDFNALYTDDCLLPAGNLREPVWGACRADVVVVTKAPQLQNEQQKLALRKKLRLQPGQHLLVSSIRYRPALPLFGSALAASPSSDASVLMVTGIANPASYRHYLEQHFQRVEALCFADHHVFVEADLRAIQARFGQMPEKGKLIFTTEKDATRLRGVLEEAHFSAEVKQALRTLPIYYYPIEPVFDTEGQKTIEGLVKAL